MKWSLDIYFFVGILVVTNITVLGAKSEQENDASCEPQFLERCVKTAEVLLQEPKNIFPPTTEDIDNLCRNIFPQTWSDFINCIKSFSPDCLSNSQRNDFNRAVGDSINSVHKMCTNDDYKSAYLRKSECIVAKSTDEEICKPYYDKLVALIQEPTSGQELCCAHESFKLCVIEESKECPCPEGNCDKEDGTETASHFAKVILEHSLGFLFKQCSSQVSAKPCVGGYVVKRPRFEPEEVVPDRGSTYFPTGESDRRPVFESEEEHTTLAVPGDSRHPKEVTTDEDFDVQDLQESYFGISGGSPVWDDPDTNHKQELVVTAAPVKHQPTSTRAPWLPDTDIEDFDEFLRTLQRAGFTSQGLRSNSMLLSATVSTLTLSLLSLLIFV